MHDLKVKKYLNVESFRGERWDKAVPVSNGPEASTQEKDSFMLLFDSKRKVIGYGLQEFCFNLYKVWVMTFKYHENTCSAIRW